MDTFNRVYVNFKLYIEFLKATVQMYIKFYTHMDTHLDTLVTSPCLKKRQKKNNVFNDFLNCSCIVIVNNK